MPFINYEIGDAGVAGPPCSCGRGFPTILRVEGRLGEAVRTPCRAVVLAHDTGSGVPASAAAPSGSTRRSAPATACSRSGSSPTSRFTPEIAAMLRAELAERVGPGMEIRLDLVAGIPLEPSGKRFVIRPPGGSRRRPRRGCHAICESTRAPPAPCSRSVGMRVPDGPEHLSGLRHRGRDAPWSGGTNTRPRSSSRTRPVTRAGRERPTVQ